MAQKFEEKIKVKYTMAENGATVTKECMLVDIPEQDKQGIISLAIFPVLNKDGGENAVVHDISKYIANMPSLNSLIYPKQFTSISVGTIQRNNCPNLHQIIRTVPEGFEGQTGLVFKGSVKSLSSTVGTTEESLSAFASAVPEGQAPIIIFEVPVIAASTTKTTTKKTFISKDDIEARLKNIEAKVSDIADKVGGDTITIEQIEEILNKFAGTLTQEQLDSVINAVNSINVNVASSALEHILEDTIKEQILLITSDINGQFQTTLQGFSEQLDRLKGIGATEEELSQYVKENIPTLLANDSTFLAKLNLIEISTKDASEKITSIDGKVDGLANNAYDYKEEILGSVKGYIDDAKAEILNSDSLSENDKQYLQTCLGLIESQTREMVSTQDNALFTQIQEKLETMPTSEQMQADTKKINSNISKLFNELTAIKDANSSNAEEMANAVNSFIKDKIPELIATNRNLTDKLFPKVDAMDRRLGDMEGTLGVMSKNLEDNEAANDLILETLGNYFDTLTNGVNISEQSKSDIAKLLQDYAEGLTKEIKDGNSSLLTEIQKIVPTEATIEKIVHDALYAHESREAVWDILIEREITDTIIGAMGGMAGKLNDNIDSVKDFVGGLLKNQEFVTQLNKILKDSDLAKCSSIDEAKDQISRNHQEEMTAIKGIVSQISEMPTKDDIKDILSNQSSYLLRRLGIDAELDKDTLVGIIKGISQEQSGMLDTILKECKDKGMTKTDMENFFMSEVGKNVLAQAIGVESIQNNYVKIVQSIQASDKKSDDISRQIAELSEQVKELTKQAKDSSNQNAPSQVNNYYYSYGLAGGITGVVNPSGVGVSAIPTGFMPGISQPYIYPQQISPDINIYINNAIRAQLSNIFGIMGVPNPPTINPINTRDKVIDDLNRENEARKKEIEDLKGMIAKLTKIVEDMSKAKTDDKSKETDDGTKPKKPEPKKETTPTIRPPQPKKETFKGKSKEMMEMLAEPKLTRGQKFKKWLKRHPLALTALGIGAGALVGAGAGVLAAGGVGALIANSMYFIPTLKTLGIGAAVGLGAGAVGEVVGRVAGLGKKDRLYRKFLKEKEKCDVYKQSMELMERAIENEKSAIDNSIDKMKSCKKLKKLKRFKKASMSKAKKMSKLRSKQRILKGQYKAQVEKFLQAKSELNAYEDRKGKTIAMGGNLQELRDARARAENEMANAEDEEEQEIIQEQLATEEQILDAHAGRKISSLSSEFKTGDAEAYEMLKDIKGRSKAMDDVMAEIESRNSTKKDTAKTVEVYDKRELEQYAKAVAEKGNEADKANLQALLAHAKEARRKASEELQMPEDQVEQLIEAKKRFEQRQKVVMDQNNNAGSEQSRTNNDGMSR